jgi:hypothetical protein
MSLKKFGQNDVIVNTMKAHPDCEFFIFDGKVYYNNRPEQSGQFSSRVLGVPPGHLSLYEYNIDRDSSTNPLIFPFVYKNSSKISFKTLSSHDFNRLFSFGDQLTSSYPMSASIHREYMLVAGERKSGVNLAVPPGHAQRNFDAGAVHPHYFALKNKLDFYGTMSDHYKVSSSHGNKNNQTINLLSVPSIFYGSEIKPGSVNLKWYFSGSLIGEVQDEKQNGELIQVGPFGSTGTGSVAGVVMYREGFILLTGSWSLNNETIGLTSGGQLKKPSWIYFGAGAKDGITTSTAGATYSSASFNLAFKGTSDTQVVTMFAHAKKGEVNYSNNPTFLQYGQPQVRHSSSLIYEEDPTRKIYNTVSSSFVGHDADYRNQVYISKVAIYDDNKNLLGIATVSNPVLKKEDQDLSFKIKLDI